MKVILHIGAHRTGTTSFQAYMRAHQKTLRAHGVGFWGPMRTRKGLFAGIQPVPGLGRSAAVRARGRILLQLDKAERQGIETLLVSDENMMGSVRLNLRTRRLYPDVGERLSRFVCAFDGRVDKVVMSVRALDHYWASSAAFGVSRGHLVPDADHLDAIANGSRTWRDVIADVACAATRAVVDVVPFERSVGRTDLLLSACTRQCLPGGGTAEWLNRRPDIPHLRTVLEDRGEDPDQLPDASGRWSPFDEQARAALRESYADDMHWLVAGANGLATLTQDLDQTRAGIHPPYGPLTRGQHDDIEKRRLAHPS